MQIYLTDAGETLIKNYIFLPVTIQVIEHDIKHLEASRLKFKQPYKLLLEQSLTELSKELRKIKEETFKQKIRFYRKNELSYEV